MIINQEKCIFNGEEYIDCSNILHHLLNEDEISIKVKFSTESSEFMSLFSVFYKESFMPDFSLDLHIGYPVVIFKGNEKENIVLSGNQALNDGKTHELILNFENRKMIIYVDGVEILSYDDLHKWCNFGYVGFVDIGRSTSNNNFGNYFYGEIHGLQLDTKVFHIRSNTNLRDEKKEKPLFYQGMDGIENYRIPSMVYADGVIIATADARIECPGDNPNHIARAIRRSVDGGLSWTDTKIILDYGGIGRESGASAIDGSLLYDAINKRLFMLYSHTKSGVGAFNSHRGTGFDDKGRMILKDSNKSTDYKIDAMENVLKDGNIICNLSVKNELMEILPTTYLKIVYSDDLGKTWSGPMDLNPMVKKEYMSFLGAGPGNGIQIKNGDKVGRLVYPIYYLDAEKKQRNGIIYSDDFGRSWDITSVSLQDKDLELTESQIIELHDGRLRMFCRNTSKAHKIITVDSNDQGDTFGGIEYIDVINPYCQLSVLEMDGKYYLSTANDYNYRLNGTLYESNDARNWVKIAQIEAGEFGYSSLARVDKGHIGILYETKNQHLKFKIIEIK